MEMNKQKMFDMAWTGLKSQGFERAVDDYGDCQYRAPDGQKCAIGHCIPDAEYDARWEGNTAEQVTNSLGWDYLGGFAEELQECHDEGRSPAAMEENLRAFAADRNLSIPDEAAA